MFFKGPNADCCKKAHVNISHSGGAHKKIYIYIYPAVVMCREGRGAEIQYGRGRRGYKFVACLKSFDNTRRISFDYSSPILLIITTPLTFGRSLRFCMYYISTFCLSCVLLACSSLNTIYFLGQPLFPRYFLFLCYPPAEGGE